MNTKEERSLRDRVESGELMKLDYASLPPPDPARLAELRKRVRSYRPPKRRTQCRCDACTGSKGRRR